MEITEEVQSTQMFCILEETCRNLKSRKEYLNSALSIADKKKSDIEHYIEFNNLSASQGYKLSKMMKDCLIERRSIKNEIEQIDQVLRMNVGFVGKGKIQSVLERTQDKQYHPRVLKELFN